MRLASLDSPPIQVGAVAIVALEGGQAGSRKLRNGALSPAPEASTVARDPGIDCCPGPLMAALLLPLLSKEPLAAQAQGV
jgi:hypothetical protein